MSNISAIASANNDVVYSNVILCSALSLESVPSISNIRVDLSLLLLIQIPLVVCYLPSVVSIVSNLVSKTKLRSVDLPEL